MRALEHKSFLKMSTANDQESSLANVSIPKALERGSPERDGGSWVTRSSQNEIAKILQNAVAVQSPRSNNSVTLSSIISIISCSLNCNDWFYVWHPMWLNSRTARAHEIGRRNISRTKCRRPAEY